MLDHDVLFKVVYENNAKTQISLVKGWQKVLKTPLKYMALICAQKLSLLETCE